MKTMLADACARRLLLPRLPSPLPCRAATPAHDLSGRRGPRPRLATRRSRWIALLILLTTGTAGIAVAADQFEGVWAANGLPCDKVFQKKNGQVSFVSYHGERAAGLIVHGNQVQGGQASCKLLSRKEQGSSFIAVLGCKEEIIFDKLVVHARFNGPNELVRFDPNVPEIETTYHRCEM